MVATLIRTHIEASESQPTFILLRRLLTALMHHVPNSEAYEPISSYVLDQLSVAIRRVQDSEISSDDNEVAKLSKLATIVIEVRKGSRVEGIDPLLSALHLDSLRNLQLSNSHLSSEAWHPSPLQ